jgi:hypothetical protein
MITVNGKLDWFTGQIYPTDTGTWDDLTTWDTWTEWFFNPELPLTWLTPTVDFAVAQDFNLKIETAATGQVSYEVYTSDTGLFDGEETTVDIASGATDVSGFHGQYFKVGVKVDKTNLAPTLQEVQVTATNQPIREVITSLDTSTLGGTISARELPLTRKYSILSDISVTVREVTAYNLDVYVTDHISCKTVIPRVVSKDRTTPTIALIGLDNVPRDGVVDISISGLPEQYMTGNNLSVK